MPYHNDVANQRRIVVTEAEAQEIGSLELHRARRFLTNLERHPFVCFVYDDETKTVKMFTKGDDATVSRLLEIAREELDQ